MSKANSNFRTSAQLEQQKQWWAPQQGSVVSSLDPCQVPMLIEGAVGLSWSLQKPKAAKSAVSHTTSSSTPAQRSRETAIRDDSSTLEEARQLPDDAHAPLDGQGRRCGAGSLLGYLDRVDDRPGSTNGIENVALERKRAWAAVCSSNDRTGRGYDAEATSKEPAAATSAHSAGVHTSKVRTASAQSPARGAPWRSNPGSGSSADSLPALQVGG